MIGPLPTGSRFVQKGVSKCYDTPTAYASRVHVNSKGIAQSWRISNFNFKRADYLGAPLPFSSASGVLRTSRGPVYITPVNYTMKSTVYLFDTLEMQGVLSGVHDVTALISTVSDLFSTLSAEAVLITPPNLYGYLGDALLSITTEALLNSALYMQGEASGIGNLADDSAALSATLTYMQGEYNTFNLAADSTAYLFTYNLTTGPLRSAAALAW